MFCLGRGHGQDQVYPPISELRELSVHIAVRVVRQAILDGVCAERKVRNLTDEQLEATIRDRAWLPNDLPLRQSARMK